MGEWISAQAEVWGKVIFTNELFVLFVEDLPSSGWRSACEELWGEEMDAEEERQVRRWENCTRSGDDLGSDHTTLTRRKLEAPRHRGGLNIFCSALR